MKNLTSYPTLTALSLIALLALPGCAELNQPGYPSQGGYYDSGYGGYHNDGYGSHDNYYGHEKHERWEEKRHEQEERAEREAREHQRDEESRRHHEQEPPRRVEEHCPSGFSPSERKCSNDERRHGCQDIRTPSGLGCVRR
jgi:hypothetical protein